MKTLSCILFTMLLAVTGGDALAQISDINMAINKAGRQRVLSQRMAKAYFQIGMKVDAERSKRVLDSSVDLFDRQLVELKDFAPTSEIRDTYLKLESAWQAYRDVLLGSAPTRENGRKVLDASEEVLTIANEGVVQLEKVSGTTVGHLVNTAGRVRFQSQRMAKYYQAVAWNIADGQAADNMENARKDFSDCLFVISNAPVNTVQIRKSLELLRQQWFFFDEALNQRGDTGNQQLAVATTSERIYQEVDSVVGLYEKLP